MSVCLFNSEHRLGEWNESSPESILIIILEEVPNLKEVSVPKLHKETSKPGPPQCVGWSGDTGLDHTRSQNTLPPASARFQLFSGPLKMGPLGPARELFTSFPESPIPSECNKPHVTSATVPGETAMAKRLLPSPGTSVTILILNPVHIAYTG